MKKILGVLSIALIVCVYQGALGDTWYVDGSVSPSGDGKTWGTAFQKIQEGIEAASHGDTVMVQQGTYRENIQFRGKNIVLTSTDPASPTVAENTVIDGSKAGSVVTFNGTENQTCVLKGFTIRNGKSGEHAGGIRGRGTHATIQNNTIKGNSADVRGGGLYECDGIIQNNTISGNSAGLGGGLNLCHGTIQNNTISDNVAQAHGGGIGFCDGTIRNSTISANAAGEFGGGLVVCPGTIQNNIITGNSAGLGGGGLSGCEGSIRDNLVAGNSAERGGGVQNCDGTIENNTIVDNSANLYGGLYFCEGTIRNCIVWGNTGGSDPQIRECVLPTYCCIQSWTGGGVGNIDSDPQFLDADGPSDNPQTYQDNNYRLLPFSPCIDKGSNQKWMGKAVDLDGNRRIIDGDEDGQAVVDTGAYEYTPLAFEIVQIMEAGPEYAVQLTWNSHPGATYTVWSCSNLGIAPWNEEETIVSQGESTSWTDSDTACPCKFYRIETQ